ncbi:hypothetical protein N7471_010760 [Penicillium samsonianum]|uniref:uncharacterized protein n=1 Tax=Penicillium samsonianum TaxID=1882272 RepID=UPI00254809FF|nr:uncharacterized protein N7471_010760 [Penicillium samsonianum]KAJ6126267.1 hypothetical protein N7471_010760 [Penicillium samsonianum]
MFGIRTNPTGEEPRDIDQLETNQGLPDQDTQAEAFFHAVRDGHEDTVRFSLNEGSDPNSFGQLSQTPPLLLASLMGRKNVVNLLLDAGAKATSDILKAALGRYQNRVMCGLIEHGADFSWDKDGNLLRLAIWEKDRELVKTLISHKANVHATGEDGLNAFAISADGDTFDDYIFRSILDAGGRPPKGYGYTRKPPPQSMFGSSAVCRV